MHPADAMALRQVSSTIRLAAEQRLAFHAEPADLGNGTTGKG
jgi:hypothetical protein